MADETARADIDRAVKALMRAFPPAFFRLAGIDIDARVVRPSDVSVDLPEFRADSVWISTTADGSPERAFHVEFQLRPDSRVLTDWFLKNAGLTRQLGIPVFLVVMYLARGRYRRFPASYTISCGDISNEFRFHAVHLWEHADRIRTGELGELAPLLLLCEDNPGEGTLREERKLIHELPVPPEIRADLLAVALMIGMRYFPRDILAAVFREDLSMVKGSGIVDDWIQEGEARGEARGETRGARVMALKLLRERFGGLPPAVIDRVEHESLEWCEELVPRVLRAGSLEELGF